MAVLSANTAISVTLRRLAGVDVYLSTSSALTGGTLCATGVAATSKGEALTITCPPTTNAQYLRIERPSATPTFLGFREVMVYAPSGAVPFRTSGLLQLRLFKLPWQMLHALSS